jgi:hypothetical protein
VIDPALAAFPVVWAGRGDELTMFATSFEQLLVMTRATPLPVVSARPAAAGSGG